MTEAATRRLSPGLGFLIFLLPMPLAFITLQNGYSPLARLLAFGWLGIAAFLTAAQIK